MRQRAFGKALLLLLSLAFLWQGIDFLVIGFNSKLPLLVRGINQIAGWGFLLLCLLGLLLIAALIKRDGSFF